MSIKFTKLSNDKDNDNNRLKNSVSKDIDIMQKLFTEGKKISSNAELDLLDNYLTFCKDDLLEVYDKLSHITSKLQLKVDSLGSHIIPLANTHLSITRDDHISPSMTIQYENGIYHYRLKSLLPHRIVFDEKSNKIRSFSNYDKNHVVNGYINAINNYQSANDFVMFDQKILALFVNYYGSGSYIDHDNLDEKPFIDVAINKILVPDDSPVYLDTMFVGITDKSYQRHTEVFAGIPSDILKTYQNLL